MAISIRDPNVRYNGKVLPRDKAPSKQQLVNPNVYYGGGRLPADAIKPVPFVDKINKPGEIIISGLTGSVTLPPDTMITISGDKRLVMTPILDNPDGVNVFEHIARKPYKIEFEGVIRMQVKQGIPFNNTNPPPGLSGPTHDIFPQEYLNNIWTNVWLPNGVLTIQNTYLNGLGIQQIVIESINPSVVRGSTNVPYHIIGWENQPGQSLIIT